MRVILLVLVLLATLSRGLAAPKAPSEFPFELRSGLIWVQVRAAGSTDPLKFLLDSGAGVSVINLHTAKRLAAKLGQRVNVRGVGGSVEGFWPQRLAANVAGVALPKEFLAVDLAELSEACDCCVDGLLGADFFRGRVVQIDFAGRKVRLLPSSYTSDDATVVDLKVKRGALLASVGVNESAAQWMRVDTGCASALQWFTSERRLQGNRSEVSVALTELDIPSTTAKVKLGSMTFDSVPIGLHSQPIFCGESGLLGTGLLARFERVTFDAKARRLVLEGRRAGF